MLRYNLFYLLPVLLIACVAHATVWYVHPDSVQNCIQDCLNMCCNGDTVLVGPGTYYENIVWPDTQGIKLTSETGPASTIIDGDSAGRVIAIARPMDTTTQITGFTIQNGYTTNDGGGILLSHTSPLITDNIITMNTALSGGGIYLSDSRAIIRNNEITNNSCDNNGGGICAYHWNESIITNNTVSNNSANTESGWGGGIVCAWVDTSYVAYNTITMNTAYAGGGIASWFYSSPLIIRNTIIENTADYGAGIECSDHTSAYIHKNTISTNTSTSGFGGIECWLLSSPLIDSCRISSNVGDGLAAGNLSEPVLHYNNIHGNTNHGVVNYDSLVTLDAENNWWADASGPGGFGPGSGDEVSDWVDYDPWLTDSMEWLSTEEFEQENAVNTQLHVYPNPFSRTAVLRYEMRDESGKDLSISIYDISGRLVRTFDPLPYAPGAVQIAWDGCDKSGKALPSGVYILRVAAGEHAETQKLLLIR